MLTEEALLVLAALGVLGLLILGVLELAWPSRPRHPLRRPAGTGRHRAWRSDRAGRASARTRLYARRPPASPAAPASAGAAALAPPPGTAESEAGREEPEEAEEAAGVEADLVPAEQGEEAVAVAAAAPAAGVVTVDEPLPVERCFVLYQEKRYQDVVAEGMAALTASAGERGAHQTAALWSVIGLAKQALGDHDGARSALQAAIELAPAADRPTYQRHLAALALRVAEALLARAQAHPNPEADERVGAIRTAIAWLDRGIAAAPDDGVLRTERAQAEAALWPAYQQVIMGLVQRQEFHAARRLLRDALADEIFPAARADEFREMLLGTFSGEIGQLTAQAIRSMQEARESEALAALQRAEELLAGIPQEALAPTRREEVDRRLWWGYTKLGVRRVEAADFEEALEPLFHALSFDAIGPDRQEETRAALVRALEGVVETRTLAIRQLLDGGDRETAVEEGERLWSLLRHGMEAGLSQDDLSVAFAKTRRLFEALGQRRD